MDYTIFGGKAGNQLIFLVDSQPGYPVFLVWFDLANIIKPYSHVFVPWNKLNCSNFSFIFHKSFYHFKPLPVVRDLLRTYRLLRFGAASGLSNRYRAGSCRESRREFYQILYWPYALECSPSRYIGHYRHW